MFTFSIIMPVYNVAPYLDQSINSIITQSFTNWEIVLIDDGSTDGSAALCDDWVKKDERISVKHKNNEGLSAARNDGLRMAGGQYILFVDSDDAIVPDCLNGIYNVIRKNPNIDVLIGKYIRYYSNGMKSYPNYNFDPVAFNDCSKCIEYLFAKIPESIWNVWRYVFKKKFLTDNHIYFKEGIYCEDVEWTPRALLQAKNIFYYETPFYLYRYQRQGSIMQSSCLKKHKDLIDSVKASLNVACQAEYNTAALKNSLVKEYIAQFSFVFSISSLERKELRRCLICNDFILYYGTSNSIRVFMCMYRLIGFNIMAISMTAIRFFYHKIKN